MFIGSASEQYKYIDKMAKLYALLQDNQSKDLFRARLQFDLEVNMDTAAQFNEIVKKYRNNAVRTGRNTWRDEFAKVASEGKKIVLYGAGANGHLYANLILKSHADFYAFCDQKKAGNTVCGKPVLPPEEIIANPAVYAVVISTRTYYDEVFAWLQEKNFPKDSILHCFDYTAGTAYFEFPELFESGTAMVDAGCYDGKDTIQFAKWCGGKYSKIFAFEPDEANYYRCKKNIEAAGIPNVELFQNGLSNICGETAFIASGGGGSYILSTNEIPVHCVRAEAETVTIKNTTIDTLTDEKIGMIKMDIEGGEFDALHGAQKVIQRDRPLLAICIYHRQGDMLAIMDYLHSLVPEYRFWLRHYGVLSGDTVLYAAI